MFIIIISWLIAATLDFVLASLLFISQTRQNPAILLKGITSAAIGPRAMQGGMGMAWAGLAFHYFIALCWTVFYFAVMPRLFACNAMLTNAVVFGMFTWVMMMIVVVPLSKTAARPSTTLMAIINILILIVAIGFPLAYIAQHYSVHL
jgi:uncharacterized membrane protein YagU involved in acid resistance